MSAGKSFCKKSKHDTFTSTTIFHAGLMVWILQSDRAVNTLHLATSITEATGKQVKKMKHAI